MRKWPRKCPAGRIYCPNLDMSSNGCYWCRSHAVSPEMERCPFPKARDKALATLSRSGTKARVKPKKARVSRGSGADRSRSGKFVVRLWDMFDGWIDVTGPVSKKKAEKIWNKETDNGSRKTKYADGDYYAIFPANTKMVVTPEFLGR